MLQSDPLEMLRRLYDQWAALKATVEAGLQTWWAACGWLLELGVVAHAARPRPVLGADRPAQDARLVTRLV
jgi:hypothetical protein